MILKNSINYDRINQLNLTAECKALFCHWLTEQNQCLNNQTMWRTRLYCQLQLSTQAQADRVIQQLLEGILSRKSHLQFLHPSQSLSTLTRSTTVSTSFCFLVTLAMVICVLPQYSHVNTGNPRRDLPDI